MVSSCSANGCTNRQKVNDTRRFHRFPVNAALQKKWIVSMRRLNWSPGSSARICSDHFTTDSYDRSKPWLNKLKPDAIPTIFNFPAHLQPKVSCIINVTQFHAVVVLFSNYIIQCKVFTKCVHIKVIYKYYM